MENFSDSAGFLLKPNLGRGRGGGVREGQSPRSGSSRGLSPTPVRSRPISAFLLTTFTSLSSIQAFFSSQTFKKLSLFPKPKCLSPHPRHGKPMCLGRTSNFSFLCLKHSDDWNATPRAGAGQVAQRIQGLRQKPIDTPSTGKEKPLLKMLRALLGLRLSRL